MERAKLIALRLYLTAQTLLLVTAGVVAVAWWLAHRDAEKEDSKARAYEATAKDLGAKRAEVSMDPKDIQMLDLIERDPSIVDELDDEQLVKLGQLKEQRMEAKAKAKDLQATKAKAGEFDPISEEEFAADLADALGGPAEARAREFEFKRAKAETSRKAAARSRERQEQLAFLGVLASSAATGLWVGRRWLRWLLKPVGQLSG